MLRYVSQYWFGGAATAAILATTAYYFSLGDSSTSCKRTHTRSKIKPAGLVNEGNTCFINTTIQALASCFPIIQWLESILDIRAEQETCKVTQSLRTTLAVVNNQHPTIDANPYYTRHLTQALEKHGWKLNSEEQDAHEFFNVLFTTIDEEINSKNGNFQGICLSESPSPSKGLHGTHLSSPFRGYLSSQLSCLTCGHKAPVHYDAFECLSIPLPKFDIKTAFSILTIEGLLKSFLAAETVGEVHCDNCSKVNGKSVFIKQLSIGKLPQCICLHIQRSDWTVTGQLTKRQDLVRFSEFVDVANFVYTNRIAGNFKPVKYRLRAVVEHLGVAQSGHFVTFRQNEVNGRVRWFYTSDTLIRSVTLEEVLKSSPYMLFYERC